MKEPKDLTNQELIDLIRSGPVLRAEHLNALVSRFEDFLHDDFSKAQEEMNRAEAKFGKQSDIPSIPGVINPFVWLGIVSEEEAKRQTDEAMANKTITWAHIALEELCEVIGCKADSERRVELIQLMAVCARWIKAIDHQARREGPNGVSDEYPCLGCSIMDCPCDEEAKERLSKKDVS